MVEICLTAISTTWRRQLGPLPWAVLEELALNAQPDQHGWIAPLGVRTIALAVGVTKDTAARAVTALRSAGLAMPDRHKTPDGRSLPGYRLNLPEGIRIGRRDNAVCPDREQSRCPGQGYSEQKPDTERNHIASGNGPPQVEPSVVRSMGRTRSETLIQTALFDTSIPAIGPTPQMSGTAPAGIPTPIERGPRSQ
jgi:hypothetical protein